MTDHQLRITGGCLRGRKIGLQKDDRARYTSSKVRKAIFDLIGDIAGFNVLDLFSGSGSFSVEALSRDALTAVCVEKDAEMGRLLRSNLANLSLDKRCLVLQMDVRYAVRRLAREGKHFDLVFLDPPYEADFVRQTMSVLARHPVCREDGLIVIEHSRREPLQAIPDSWFLEKHKTYGDTMITVLRHMTVRSEEFEED